MWFVHGSARVQWCSFTLHLIRYKAAPALRTQTICPRPLTLDYDTSQFGGKKKLILATTKWSIGGKNYSLGTIYLLFGGLYCLLAVLFMVKQTSNPRYGY